MTKEELIISILKSKQSIAELFKNNNNLCDNKISDIRRILSRLRDILPKKDRKEIKEISSIKQNIKEIFQKKKMMNILENQSEFLIIKKNTAPTIPMILVAFELEIQKIYLISLMKKAITNQYQ